MSDSEDEAPPKKKRGGKLLLLLLLPVILLLGGGAAAYFMGLVPLPSGEVEAATADPGEDVTPDTSEITFVTVPDLLVNLNPTGGRLRFLKFVAALEVVGEENAAEVERLLPRVSDNMHAYLRAVDLEELGGPDAVYRVKRDLLMRVNQVVGPIEIRDVLIREMLIQ